MVALNFFVAIFFSGVLLARLPQSEAVAWAALGGCVAGLALSLLRWWVPAQVRRPSLAEAAPDTSAVEGGWDVGGAVIAAVLIPVVMLFGFLMRGWLLVLIVGLFTAAASEPSALNVAASLACSIAISAAAEFAVVHPLYRRWDISLD